LIRAEVRNRVWGPLLALGLSVVFAGTVLATGASGFHATTLARGTMDESVGFNTGSIKFQTKAAVDFVTVAIAIDAHGSSGWHNHPGVVLVTLQSGTLVQYDALCAPIVHLPGSSYTESGDDLVLVRNETDSPALVYATYLVAAGTTGLRIDQPQPATCAKS